VGRAEEARPGPAATRDRAGEPRERTGERLLRSTAALSYDPEVDIDWSAPLVEGKGYMLPHRCSLYGTPLWDRLSPAQRLELGKHEAASVAGFGIWLEMVLMRMLAKITYHGDPATRHVQYALAEMAEECRHSTMFARMIERLGTPVYRPSARVHWLGSMLPAISYGPALWGAILIGEEIPDRYQREMAGDESIQPLMRMVNRIHITEEARHIGFARAEFTRSIARLSKAEVPYHRILLGRVAYIVTRNLISPDVYTSVGLNPRVAHDVALKNPHHRESLRYGGQKIVDFLGDAGMIGAPATALWRKSFLVT
jgi:P-aminobenzoate N-oxygenase AurF